MTGNNSLCLSALGHTWILDLDGTILIHNGYKTNGIDEFVPGAKAFLESLPEEDCIVFITSRKKEYQKQTETFLKDNGIRYNCVIYEAPYGERILINDSKPSGLQMAYACAVRRDTFDIKWVISQEM